MIGISVIMPSYLGEYPGSRKNPESKFIRAVESFILSELQNKELIIVSDGCGTTNKIYNERFKDYDFITLIQVEKRSETWPGELRECGRSLAKYDWITYLDTDDIYLNNHLTLVMSAILDRDKETTVLINDKYVFPLPDNPNKIMLGYVGMDIDEYNSFRITRAEIYGERVVTTRAMGHYGTWQIVHHKDVPHRWKNTDTMGEDTFFIENLKSTEKWQTFTGTYLICHNTKDRKVIWEM